MLATALVAGLLAATLVRFAPGFDADESALDPGLRQESIQALQQERSGEKHIFAFYRSYLRNALHGDLGSSRSLEQPVRSLLHDRWRVTAHLVVVGLFLAWTLALGLALSSALLQWSPYELLGTTLSGTALCIPAGVFALLSVLLRIPGEAVVACIVYPKIHRYTRNLVTRIYHQPYILSARSRGVNRARILLLHVLPMIGPQLAALAGISVGLAVGATVPVESLLGLPGLGQLAWQAALARDLPLLVSLTLAITLVTLLANCFGDVIAEAIRTNEA
ncbi:MAG TPA: ABC transporter permease subunit [Terriglobales bacterium]|nr:ABC transporter permease subunit [Terriglobales bacterium]